MPTRERPRAATIADVKRYWNTHIHDLAISRHEPGSAGFFADLDQYHFEKLHHLLRLVDFDGWRGRDVLEVGCGAGVDLMRFARGGARVTGVDLASASIALAARYFETNDRRARLLVGDGERLPFAAGQFDLVYAHGVVQYTPGDRALILEARRVLKPGGTLIVQVYNRVSWLNALSKIMKVDLEHEDAPVLRKYSPGELGRLVSGFSDVRIVPERFPVRSRLHGGWKGRVYNGLFVGVFNAVPRPLVRRFGWHLLAFCRK